MKRKLLSFMLALTFLFTIMPIFTVSSADTPTPYIVGDTASGTRAEGNDVWYSMQIDSDGLYKVSHRTTTTHNYAGGHGKVLIYNNAGNDDVSAWTGSYRLYSGYEIERQNFNELEQAFIHKYAVYLHKGTYLLREHDGKGINTYSFTVEKINSPNGEDKEANDEYEKALALKINETSGGALGGVRDDGTKDIHDYYVFTIPEPMEFYINVISDRAYLEISIFDSTGKSLTTAQRSTYNNMKNDYQINYTVNFKEAGTYYIRISTYQSTGADSNFYYYTSYILTLGGEEPKTGILYGDVNGDGKVNIADLILLSRWLAGFDDNTLLGPPPNKP